MNFEIIKESADLHLAEYEKIFRRALSSSVPLLDKILQYIIRNKGKQVRPLYVFFSAGICGEISQKTYRAASLIELLHNATLIHDDVIDDSNERRGFFSLNALWKNKISVLTGDYLLARGLLLAVENDDFDLLKIVTNSVKMMSEGELMQIQKARTLDINEKTYFEVITKKTASLIASCFQSGAASAGADPATQEKFRLMGEFTGIAFQIKDDLLDLTPGKTKGKPTGSDLKEQKLTLPLIHVLGKSSFLERRNLMRTVKSYIKRDDSFYSLLEKIKSGGGIDYAQTKMEENLDNAYKILDTFPDNQSKRSLQNLIRFTVERER